MPGKAPQQLRDFVTKNHSASGHITLTIPRTQVSVKYITLPSTRPQEIKQMVDYEISNLYPYKNEELVYDHTLVEEMDDGSSRIMLVATTRDIIENACNILQDAGLVPATISVSTVALYNHFMRNRSLPAHYLVINVDDSLAEILFICKDKLEFTRAVKLDPFRDAASQVLEALETTTMVLLDLGNRVDVSVLCGSNTGLEEIASRIKEALGLPVEIDRSVSAPTEDHTQGARLNINLLPADIHTQQKKKTRRRELLYVGILLGINLIFVINVIYVRIKVKREYLKWLNNEVARIEGPASDLRKKAFSVELLNKYGVSGKKTLALLFEVYRCAPAGVSLNALDISHRKTGGVITVSGQAQDPDAVLKFSDALKKSVLISGTDVHYIKKQKSPGQEQKVDFELIATFTI